MRHFVIHSISRYDRWKDFFSTILEHITAYKVFIPDHDLDSPEGPLTQGKSDFLSLPGISIADWQGMADSIEISGPMTEQARSVFLKFQQDAFDGFMPQLWSFQFQDEQGRVILRVEDFTVCLCWFPDEIMEILEKKGFFPSEMIEAAD